MEAEISAKANFSQKAKYAHSPDEYVTWDDSVSAAANSWRYCCAKAGLWWQGQVLYVWGRADEGGGESRAGGTERGTGHQHGHQYSSPMDVSCSKTATGSNTHHGHFVKHLHDHGLTAPTGLDGLDYRQFFAPDDFFPVSIFGQRLLHCLQKADSASSLLERIMPEYLFLIFHWPPLQTRRSSMKGHRRFAFFDGIRSF